MEGRGWGWRVGGGQRRGKGRKDGGGLGAEGAGPEGPPGQKGQGWKDWGPQVEGSWGSTGCSRDVGSPCPSAP